MAIGTSQAFRTQNFRLLGNFYDKTDNIGNVGYRLNSTGDGTKWLADINENSGILTGGVLSATIGGTTFNVSAGTGQIVSNSLVSGEVVATYTKVSWNAQNNVALTYRTSHQFSYIYIDENGNLQQQNSTFTDAEYRNKIVLGVICHINLSTINLVTNRQNVAYGDSHRLYELISSFGPIKRSGLSVSAYNTSLRISRAAGTVFSIGCNYASDQFDADSPSISAANPALLCRVYQNGSGGFIFDVNSGSYYTDIDPNKYDNASGTLQTVNNNQWTIQRLYFFPNNPNDVIAYYGRAIYNSYDDAVAALSTESFSEATITAENAVFLGYLVVRGGATNLSTSADAVFFQSGAFRNIGAGGAGGGGGGASPTNLDDLGDVSISSPSDSQFLIYDNGTSLWRNASLTASSPITFTGVGTSLSLSVSNNAISFAKIQQISTSRVLGRISSGTGNIEELTGANIATIIGDNAVENATKASSLAAGIAGVIPYQADTGITDFTAAGTAGQVLLSAGSDAPYWANQSALSVGSLASPVTLWGQSFDGTANITGSLSSVGNITGDGAITITAGGSNQNVTLTPSGTGYTLLNGNVGIGTTNPSFKLQINDAATTGAGLLVRGGGAGGIIARFERNIGGTGNIDINSSSNNPQISFNAENNIFVIGVNNNTGGGIFQIADNSTLGANTRFVIDTSGNVGIGTTVPTDTLDVNGTARIRTVSASGSEASIFLTTDANGVLVSRTVAQVRSDIGAGTGNGTVTSIAAGDGLSGGTITSSGTIAVNSTVVRTSGNQTIGGTKTFSSTISGSIDGSAVYAANISNGDAGQIPYQTAVNATAFSQAGISNQVLLSGGTGAPTWANQSSLSVGTSATLTTTRKIWGQDFNGSQNVNGNILDTSDNELIKFASAGESAANEITVTNASASSNPSIAASGSDTNISLNLISKGAGNILINGKAISLANSLSTVGDNALTLTTTGATNVTLPTTGTLATTSQIPTVNNATLTIAADNGLGVSATPTFTANASVDKIITLSIADSGVTVAKLADNAVETAKIKDNNVTLAKLAQITGPVVLGKVDAGAGNVTTLTGANIATIIGANPVQKATALATTRTLWGQDFNGTANVVGNLISVGNITGSSAITIAAGDSNQNVTLTPSGTGYTLLNGNVGIGTTIPNAKLKITSTGDIAYLILNTSSTANKRTRLQFTQNDNNGLELGTDYGLNNENNFYFYDRVNTHTFAFFSNSKTWINGDLGVGLTNPSNKLVVSGAASIGSATYNTAAPTNGLLVEGNVGIGTSTIFAKLVVSNGSGENIEFNPGNSTWNGTVIESINRVSPTTRPDLILYTGAASNGSVKIVTNNTERMRITSGGNVGIGTTVPAGKLDVNGAVHEKKYALSSTGATAQWVKVGRLYCTQEGRTFILKAYIHQGYNAANSQDFVIELFFKTSNNNSLNGNGFAANSWYYAYGFNVFDVTPKWVGNAAGLGATYYDLYLNLPAHTLGSHYSFSIVNADASTYWVDSPATGQTDPGSGSSTVLVADKGFNFTLGNIGIGSIAPANKLNVLGSASIGSATYNIAAPTNGLLVEGNVGIGTTSPAQKLHVDGNIAIQSSGKIGSGTGYGCSGCSSYTDLELYSASTGNTTLNNQGYNIYLQTAGTSRLSILNGGNVGIGTTTPTEKLHVEGNIKVNGDYGIGAENTGGATHVTYCGGGQFQTNTQNSTGYLKITLPQSWSNTMMHFYVDVFEYVTGKSKTFSFSGYNYIPDSAWYNCSAYLLTDDDADTYTARFGHDGTKCAIYISKAAGSASDWQYLQVAVRDFHAGFQNYTLTKWVSGWDVSVTETLGTITAIRSISRSLNTNNISGTTNYVSKFTAANNLANSLIYSASTKVGIGTTSPNGLLTLVGAGSDNTYSGVLRVADTSTNKWGGIGFPDVQGTTTAANNNYLIGRGASYNDRTLSFHIPNAADYGSGNQPFFGFYSSGSVLLSSIESSTGNSYIKGNLGIGVTNPTNKLVVIGAASIGSATYNTAAPANGLLVEGNVGIGITNPDCIFNVKGAALSSTLNSTVTLANFQSSNSNASYLRIIEKRFSAGSDWTTASTRIQKTTDVTDQAYIEFNPSGGNYGLAFGAGTASEAMRIINGGSIGIGTTSPDALLHVATGHIHVGNATAFDNTGSWNKTILIDGTSHARLRVRATAYASGNNNVNEAYLWVDNSTTPYSGLYADYGFRLQTGSGSIILSPASNVGIGTTNPSNTLDVNGAARIRTVSASGSAASIFLTTDANGVLVSRTVAQVRSDIGAGTGSGTVTSVTLATDSTGTDVGVTNPTVTTSGTITLNIPSASATARGVITTGAQTIAGTKTFSSTISGSIDGNAGTVTNGVYTTGDQTIAGVKTFSDNILIGKDIGLPASTTTAYGQYSAHPAAGPASFLELIESLSNAIGVNDPIRFRSIITPEKYITGAWSADAAPPAYSKLIDGNATSEVNIISFTDYDTSGITARRFTVDLSIAYRRPNFITIQSDYGNNAFYGYSVLIEKSTNNSTWTNACSTQTVANNTAKLLAFSLGDLSNNRYLRFTFTATQAITSSGALKINRIRSYGNQYYGSIIPVYTDSSGYLYSTYTTLLASTSGSVGVGTISPVQKLHVESGVGNPATSGTSQNGIARLSNTNDNAVVDFGMRSSGAGAWIQSTDKTDLSTNYPLLLNPNGGNVGIGISSPAFPLQVRRAGGLGSLGISIDNYLGASTRDVLFKVTPDVAGDTGGFLFRTYNGADVNAMTILAAGNVGIGITTPTYKTEIYSGAKTSAFTGLAISNFNNYDGTASSLVTSQLRFSILEATLNASQRTFAILESGNEYNNSSSDGFFAISTRLSAVVSEKFRITSAGNVGIGTTAPTAPLHICFDASVYPTQNAARIVSLSYSGITGAHNWALRGVYQYSSGVASNASGGDLDLIKSLDRNTILATKTDGTALGNVGIGITAPANRLVVSGAASIGSATYNTAAPTNGLLVEGNVGIGGTSPDALLHVATGHIHVGDATAFDNPASWNKTILIDGSSHARLRVRATAYASGNNNLNETYLWVDNSITPYSGLFANYGFRLQTGNGSVVLSPASGNVGIGTTSPAVLLHLGSSNQATAAYGLRFGLDTSANLYRSGPASIKTDSSFVVAGTLTELSALRYKENIVPISNILDKVCQIQPISYNKKGKAEKEYGVIAEEVNELFPELISRNADGDIDSVNYSRLTVLLIQAVKELKAEVEKLKNK